MKAIDRHVCRVNEEEQALRELNARPGRTHRPIALEKRAPVVGLPLGTRISLTHAKRKSRAKITLPTHPPVFTE